MRLRLMAIQIWNHASTQCSTHTANKQMTIDQHLFPQLLPSYALIHIYMDYPNIVLCLDHLHT